MQFENESLKNVSKYQSLYKSEKAQKSLGTSPDLRGSQCGGEADCCNTLGGSYIKGVGTDLGTERKGNNSEGWSMLCALTFYDFAVA